MQKTMRWRLNCNDVFCTILRCLCRKQVYESCCLVSMSFSLLRYTMDWMGVS